MPTETVLLIALLILIGGLMHFLPEFTRPGVFFAVTVAPEFRRSSGGRRILRRYRAIVWIATLVAAGVELAAGLTVAALLLQVAGYLWGLLAARRTVLAHAAAPDSILEVDLALPPERFPGGPLVAVLPVLFLAALGVWVGFHWGSLPRHFAVHWGIHGADRWVATTPSTVFGLLAVYAGICLLMAGLGWGLLYRSRRISTAGAGAASERGFRRRVLQLTISTAYFVALGAWVMLFRPDPVAMDVWGLALAAVIAAFCVSLVRGGQGGSRRAAPTGASPLSAPLGDRTPDACWKWGLIYFNPADPSILIEKRFGIGYTLNFGNRWTWLVLALLLVAPAAGLIFLR